MRLLVALAKVAAKHCALGFKRRRGLKIAEACINMTLANFAKAAAKPRIPISAIYGNSAIKPSDCLGGSVAGGNEEPLEGERLRVARCQGERSSKSFLRVANAAKAELQFCHSSPAKREVRRASNGLARGSQRSAQIGMALLDIGFSQQGGRARRHGTGRNLLALDGGNHTDQCLGEIPLPRIPHPAKERPRFLRLADGEQQTRAVNAFGVGLRRAVCRILFECGQQVPLAPCRERIPQNGNFLISKLEFRQVENSGVIKHPLHRLGELSGQHRGACRFEAGFGHALLPCAKVHASDGVAQRHLAIEDGHYGGPGLIHFQHELGAAHSRRCPRRIEAILPRLVAVKEVNDTAPKLL